MSIDSLTITPNPVNIGQGFVISVVATPEEIPTPSTEYKMPTVLVRSSVSYGASGLLDESTAFGHEVENSSEKSAASFILRGYKFPELSGHTIVGFQCGMMVENYAHFANSPQGTAEFKLVTGLTDGASTYTSITNAIPIAFNKKDSFTFCESDIIEDQTALTWLNSHITDVINGTTNFGIRGRFIYADIAFCKLKFYYI